MKGKGKSMQNVSVDKECPVLFPDISSVSHTVECPRYTSILAGVEGECISLDDVDDIQSELENLLAAAGKRLKLLKTEIGLLLNCAEKKDKRPGKLFPECSSTTTATVTSSAVTSCSSSKRTKPGDDKPSKKFRDSSGKGCTPSAGSDKVSRGKQECEGAGEAPGFVKKVPINDTVDKFWAFVEPYCTEVTSDDIKFLEEVFRSHEEDAEYFKIPSLGKHYSQKWAHEDLADDQREGSRITDKRRSLNNNNNTQETNTDYTDNLLKKAEAMNEDHSPFGPLTQRLVSALIEENIMTTGDETMADLDSENVEEVSSLSPRALARQLNVGNPTQLERRIKRELEEQGIIDADEKEEDNRDDEVLQELRRKQQELRAVTQQNHAITKRLLKLAKAEMVRQDLKKKLIAADAEVMDAYRRIQSSRLKKKPVTKKEKDAVWRALKDREAIVKQLEAA